MKRSKRRVFTVLLEITIDPKAARKQIPTLEPDAKNWSGYQWFYAINAAVAERSTVDIKLLGCGDMGREQTEALQ